MKYSFLTILLCCAIQFVNGQSHTISGYIRDASTGENLIGATIYSVGDKTGTTTNYYGFFSLTLPDGNKEILISYVGYEEFRKTIDLKTDISTNFDLKTDLMLEEVVISGEPELAERTQMSTISLSAKEVKALPALLGEVDVLKTIQLMPGIQSGSEGSSGLYVRGGGPDQNLILLDGVPVYNASHLFGFFSVFNADAINNVNVIKGGFPARYGGRLSSVIDISMKEGNNQSFHGEGSIGLISSKLTLEGPIISDKTSFIIAGRRTYIDVLASPLIKAASQGSVRAGYYFYDLNAKVNHRFSDRDRVFVSAYTGLDKGFSRFNDSYFANNQEYEYEEYAGLDWGNLTTAVRWNHVFSPKLFGNLSATYSKYQFDINSEFSEDVEDGDRVVRETEKIRYFSGIRDYALRLDFDYDPSPDHAIKTGVNITQHQFNPGVLALTSDIQNDTTLGADKRNALEYFVYAEDDYTINKKL
ncbi:MAG: carboxypeptidase-like regulatory domain-containing protein, partial [Cyclobacteriaceae bacterium]